MNFLERALTTVNLGVPVIRLRPRTKIAMDTNWPSLATTDINTLEKWNQETPEANVAAVAQAQLGATWFFEIDDPSIPSRIEKETGQKIPTTYRVRSRPGRGHYYWKVTSESLALGNVAQPQVKNQDFSVRMDSEYVVAANSIHPHSGLPYEIVSDAPIVECPVWIIDWIKNQRTEKKNAVIDNGTDIISEGGRNARLASIAGKLRQAGLDHEALEAALLDTNRKRCEPPLPDDEVRTIAASISKYPIGKEDLVLVGGRPAGSPQQSSIVITDAEDAVEIKPIPYPKWPGDWVMEGTSIFEGLVRPFCEVNSRYEHLMFLPALAILLNIIGVRVRVERKNLIPSIFMVLIGRRGKVLKSSSVEDSIKYFEYTGLLGHGEPGLNNANGRALVYTVGSMEGFGKELQRTGCRNGILFFDEMKTLTEKSGIENSTLATGLLTAYESGKLQNTIKHTKDSYSILPGTYVASLLACSTDKNFNANWSKLAGSSSGLTDRFMFVLPPEVLKPLTPYIHVETQEGAIKTRQLIDKAFEKGVYRIFDSSPLNKFTAENEDSNRAEIRAEKWALGLAVDLGLDEISEECIERALAIVKYEIQVKDYLKTYEATTREGQLQLEIIHNLRRSGGSMTVRELYRVLHPERHGSSLWTSTYNGLIKSGWMREEGNGVRGEPKKIVLLRVPEEDDD